MLKLAMSSLPLIKQEVYTEYILSYKKPDDQGLYGREHLAVPRKSNKGMGTATTFAKIYCC